LNRLDTLSPDLLRQVAHIQTLELTRDRVTVLAKLTAGDADIPLRCLERAHEHLLANNAHRFLHAAARGQHLIGCAPGQAEPIPDIVDVLESTHTARPSTMAEINRRRAEPRQGSSAGSRRRDGVGP